MTTVAEMGAGRKVVLAFAAVFSVLFGLCAAAILVITGAQAWREHVQASWPEVAARVNDCSVTRTSVSGSSYAPHRLYIRCVFNYALGSEQNSVFFFSMTFPDSEVWQYPPNQMAPYEDWVERHPRGTPLTLRYDPANHRKAVMVADFFPHGGPQTVNNVKMFAFFGIGFVLLFALVQVTRPRPDSPGDSPSMAAHA